MAITKLNQNQLNDYNFNNSMATEKQIAYWNSLKGKPSGMLGKKHNKEAKQKMRQAKLDRPVRNYWIDHPMPPEMLEKMRKAKLGRKLSEETKKKMSEVRKANGCGKWNKGSANWSWKGGITPLNRLERRKFLRTTHKLVLRRDNYTCQMCGYTGDKLQVDHIQRWADYVELRFDMDNCRTLCNKCHYKITFGREMPETVKDWCYLSNKGEKCLLQN